MSGSPGYRTARTPSMFSSFRRPRTKFGLVYLAAAALLCACTPNNTGPTPTGSPSDPNELALVDIVLLVSSNGAPECALNTKMSYKPVPGKGLAAGQQDEVTHPIEGEVPTLSPSTCQFSDVVDHLKQGDWQISSSSGTACTVSLHGGENVVTIDESGKCVAK